MQKMDSVFMRAQVDRKYLARDEVTPGCDWVLAGEGTATVKIDGTACAIIDGKYYKRHRQKEEKGDPPAGWIHWDFDPDQKSGHGWLPVVEGDPSSRYHLEALANAGGSLSDGTYELVGPKVGKNPEGVSQHMLLRHGAREIQAPRDFDGLRQYLEDNWIEGVVWHHPDGRMAKIKRRDFGLEWFAK